MLRHEVTVLRHQVVGTVGVANVMVISVLERRSEIGLRRTLGAAKGNIRVQFLPEAIMLAPSRRRGRHHHRRDRNRHLRPRQGWAIVIATQAWAARLAAALLIGALAGLLPACLPALRGARVCSPKPSRPRSTV